MKVLKNENIFSLASFRLSRPGCFRFGANAHLQSSTNGKTKNVYYFVAPRRLLGSSLIPGPMVVEIATLLR